MDYDFLVIGAGTPARRRPPGVQLERPDRPRGAGRLRRHVPRHRLIPEGAGQHRRARVAAHKAGELGSGYEGTRGRLEHHDRPENRLVASWSEGSRRPRAGRVTVLRGRARFTVPKEFPVRWASHDGRADRARHGLLPGRPRIEGIERAPRAVSFLEQPTLPARLVVIGGGATAWSSASRSAGPARVTVLHRATTCRQRPTRSSWTRSSRWRPTPGSTSGREPRGPASCPTHGRGEVEAGANGSRRTPSSPRPGGRRTRRPRPRARGVALDRGAARRRFRQSTSVSHVYAAAT